MKTSMLRCSAFAFALISAIALTVAVNCNEPSGGDRLALERVQKETTFRIVLPGYLPEGFGGFSIIPPIPVGERYTQVTMAFSGPQEELIQIMETDHPWGNPEASIGQPYTFKEIKGTRIATREGSFMFGAPGLIARWDHRGVHFDITTEQVFWPEVEKVIASMIE